MLLLVRSRQHVCLPCYCCRPVLPELPCSLREELKHAHTRTLNFAGPTAAVSPSLLRWSAQAAPCVRLLARCRAWSAPPPSRAGILYRFLRSGGLRSFPLLPRALSQPACCPCPLGLVHRDRTDWDVDGRRLKGFPKSCCHQLLFDVICQSHAAQIVVSGKDACGENPVIQYRINPETTPIPKPSMKDLLPTLAHSSLCHGL